MRLIPPCRYVLLLCIAADQGRCQYEAPMPGRIPSRVTRHSIHIQHSEFDRLPWAQSGTDHIDRHVDAAHPVRIHHSESHRLRSYKRLSLKNIIMRIWHSEASPHSWSAMCIPHKSTDNTFPATYKSIDCPSPAIDTNMDGPFPATDSAVLLHAIGSMLVY